MIKAHEKIVNIHMDADLWYQVSIMAAKLYTTKKDFVETALREKLERESLIHDN
jgi:Arc/MetJ family transcription regulator